MARRPVATGYVDLGSTGATELRIHGVGGTSMQELLDHPHAVQVAGDATSGFYRRWDTDVPVPDPVPGEHHVEGFSWGGMTSGSARRALWLLLIPFLLVNVAHWALPGRAAQRRWANTAAQRLLRVLALSLTMTLVLAASETGIDLIGRQCNGTTSCFKSAPSWLGWIGHDRVRLICLGAVIPLATILLLWLLGRGTWRINEQVEPNTARDQQTTPEDPALADPLFWAGAEPVRRLRALHLSAGLATAAVIQVLPVLSTDSRGFALAVLALAGLVVAISGLGVLGDGVARPHHRRLLDQDLTRRAPLLTGVAAVVFASALVVDLLPGAGPDVATGHDLRRLDGLVQGLFGAQTAMVVLLAAFVLLAGLLPGAVQAGRRKATDQLIAPALAVMAWLMAWFFTAGLTVRVAHQLFGNANAAVPSTYIVFAALIGPGALVVLVGVGVPSFRWYRAEASRQRAHLGGLPPPPGPAVGDRSETATARTSALAKVRARGRLLDIAPQMVVAATVASVVFAIVALVVALASPGLTAHPWAQQLADFGTLALGLGILKLLAVARKAWQSGKSRRSIGILWDLGTFWPRAAHPLAPPCYCERALPQLHTRLSMYGGQPDDRVVVAGHSQGSVISAALLLMPRPADVPARMSLVTYGCPLGRLYGRAFPGYLGPQVLGVGAEPVTPGQVSPAPLTLRSQVWRWLNLYRGTDPIGGYVGVPHAGAGPAGQPFGPSGAIVTGEVDVELVDPDYAVAPGDIFAAGPAGHSHYREDATYDAAVDALL